jgi:hypothetical protein
MSARSTASSIAAAALLVVAALGSAHGRGSGSALPPAVRTGAFALAGAALAAGLAVFGLSAFARRARRAREPHRAPRRILISTWGTAPRLGFPLTGTNPHATRSK